MAFAVALMPAVVVSGRFAAWKGERPAANPKATTTALPTAPQSDAAEEAAECTSKARRFIVEVEAYLKAHPPA
ncbi:hypothetical protein FJY70_03030 [candidate division WOR-3 bacterium]|nr:hypothetical protein [candidate division WOR-3 bacterium]